MLNASNSKRNRKKSIFDRKFLGEAHIRSAHWKGARKKISARISIERFETVATRGIACRDSVRSWSDKLRCEIGGIEHRSVLAGLYTEGVPCSSACLAVTPGASGTIGFPMIVTGAQIEARDRTRKVIYAIRLAAPRNGLPANCPAVDRFTQPLFVSRKLGSCIAVIDQEKRGSDRSPMKRNWPSN